jgi:hypothetical protein
MLNLIDEFTRECLAIRVDRKLNSKECQELCVSATGPVPL